MDISKNYSTEGMDQSNTTVIIIKCLQSPLVTQSKSTCFCLELLLPLDQVCHPLDHLVHKRNFVLTHAVHVGNVAHTIICGLACEASRATCLELAVCTPLLEVRLLRRKRDHDHHGGAETGAAI